MSAVLTELLILVALRKESVDRNMLSIGTFRSTHKVALRKESVDRNMYRMNCHLTDELSLSARRAWIEINFFVPFDVIRPVALRKESVDRNFGGACARLSALSSLSARRAWIEIFDAVSCPLFFSWSLSARRAWIEILWPARVGQNSVSRSPQGERG